MLSCLTLSKASQTIGLHLAQRLRLIARDVYEERNLFIWSHYRHDLEIYNFLLGQYFLSITCYLSIFLSTLNQVLRWAMCYLLVPYCVMFVHSDSGLEVASRRTTRWWIICSIMELLAQKRLWK